MQTWAPRLQPRVACALILVCIVNTRLAIVIVQISSVNPIDTHPHQCTQRLCDVRPTDQMVEPYDRLPGIETEIMSRG